MIRHFQIWICSCPRRSLLLLRETQCPGRQAVRHVRIQNVPPRRSETGSCSLSVLDSNKDQLGQNPLVKFASKDNSVSYPPLLKTTAAAAKINKLSDLNNDHQDFHNKPNHVLDWCGPLILSWTFPKRIVRTQFNLHKSRFPQMQHFVQPFGSLAHRPLSLLNHHRSPQAPSVSVHPVKGLHQPAPRVTDTWRDCLSPLNENRCRLKLEPNLKLYQINKGRDGATQSQGKNQARWASVLVSLCSVQGEPAFLFTLRSSTLKGRHKGDVSFAGGKSDPSDGDVVTTALREAQEELGIRVSAEKVWGVLKPLRDVSGMMIAPVLANLGPLDDLSFKPNPSEVEEIFTLSVSHLCNPSNCGYTHFRTGDKYGYTLPVFCNGKHRVWGLTAVALNHTLKLLIPR